MAEEQQQPGGYDLELRYATTYLSQCRSELGQLQIDAQSKKISLGGMQTTYDTKIKSLEAKLKVATEAKNGTGEAQVKDLHAIYEAAASLKSEIRTYSKSLGLWNDGGDRRD